jgi:hypothetical protein
MLTSEVRRQFSLLARGSPSTGPDEAMLLAAARRALEEFDDGDR